MGRECNIPQQVVASLNSLFENGLLPFGVLEHVVTGGWTLPPADVPGLLDQYGWKDDARREHMQLLLSMVLCVSKSGIVQLRRLPRHQGPSLVLRQGKQASRALAISGSTLGSNRVWSRRQSLRLCRP